MKVRNSIVFALLLATCGGVSQARNTFLSPFARPAPALRLEVVVRQARVHPITPRAAAPSWMDYARVRDAFAFMKKHHEFIPQVLATSSLSATFAARDITPVLMQTGRIPHDFSQRLKETGQFMDSIMHPSRSRKEFLAQNLKTAYTLGRLHSGVAKKVTGALHWDPKEHVPINQQAYGFVLSTFAWWPVEALEATKQMNPAKERRELEGWFHFWSVVGYEMGVSEELLPVNYARAKELAALLRKAQYPQAGENAPEGVSVLLGGQVRWLAERTKAQSPHDTRTPEQLQTDTAKSFAQLISLSPGLAEALELGTDPAARLVEYAAASEQH